jgi:hypothetical protein
MIAGSFGVYAAVSARDHEVSPVGRGNVLSAGNTPALMAGVRAT